MPVLESACVRALICTGELTLGGICSISCSRQHRPSLHPLKEDLRVFGGAVGAGAESVPAWNDEGLEEDVATLSYEHALRTHARYRPAAGEDPPRVAELPPLRACLRHGGEPNQRKPGSEAARRARESLERI